MRNLIGIAFIVIVVIALLIFTGVLNLSPEGEQAIEGAQQNVGEAMQNTGEAIQGVGDSVTDPE